MSDAEPVARPTRDAQPRPRLPQPSAGRRTTSTDKIQIFLLLLFVAAFFVSAALHQAELILLGDIGSVVFLGLAASITLYYFLESVAEVHAKTYSLTGAGALFLVVIGAGWAMHREGSVEQLRDRERTIQELRDSLALAASDRQIDGQVITVAGQAVNGEAHNLGVGVVIDGLFYSGRDGEHRFRVSNLPPRPNYTLLVYDPASKTAFKTTQLAPEEVERPRASVAINAVVPEAFVPR